MCIASLLQFVCAWIVVAAAARAESIAALVPSDDAQIETWIQTLGAPEFEQRAEATKALLEAGDAAVPQLKYWRAKLTGPEALERIDTLLDRHYERVLYELGAIPATEWRTAARLKAGAALHAFDGWLRPCYAASVDEVGLRTREQYRLPRPPLTFEQYARLLDVGEFQRSHSRLQYVVMRFALENMFWQQIPIEDPTPILNVYLAQIGLEEDALSLLAGRLPSAKLMELIQTYRDPELIKRLPPPQLHETEYCNFLAAQADSEKWGVQCRRIMHELLFRADPSGRYRPFKAFLLEYAPLARQWDVRASLYGSLIKLADAESLAAARAALGSDSSPECRHAIWRQLREQNLASPDTEGLTTVVPADQRRNAARLFEASGRRTQDRAFFTDGDE